MGDSFDWVDIAGRLLIVAVGIYLVLSAASRGPSGEALQEALRRQRAKAPFSSGDRKLDRLRRRARSFVARFLAEAGVEPAAEDGRALRLEGRAYAFWDATWRDRSPGFVPTERQLERCLDGLQALVKYAVRHHKIYAFAYFDVEGLGPMVNGYLLRFAFAGRALPSRPELTELMRSGMAEWPGMKTENRPTSDNDAYGWLALIVGLLDGGRSSEELIRFYRAPAEARPEALSLKP